MSSEKKASSDQQQVPTKKKSIKKLIIAFSLCQIIAFTLPINLIFEFKKLTLSGATTPQEWTLIILSGILITLVTMLMQFTIFLVLYLFRWFND